METNYEIELRWNAGDDAGARDFHRKVVAMLREIDPHCYAQMRGNHETGAGSGWLGMARAAARHTQLRVHGRVLPREQGYGA